MTAASMSADSQQLQQRNIRRTVGGVLLFIGAILTLFLYGLYREPVLDAEALKAEGTFLFDNPRRLPPFSLAEAGPNGVQPFNIESLQGSWSLIFFGFTYCPDICPTTMALLKRFYEAELEGKYGGDLQVILVSVDPGRDTPEAMRDYVQFFNSDLRGVSGEFLDLHRFATSLSIPFNKVPGGGENYLVEHSGNVAIVNPLGHYVGFFKAPLSQEQLSIGYRSTRAIY